jgi:hypothetical protein
MVNIEKLITNDDERSRRPVHNELSAGRDRFNLLERNTAANSLSRIDIFSDLISRAGVGVCF